MDPFKNLFLVLGTQVGRGRKHSNGGKDVKWRVYWSRILTLYFLINGNTSFKKIAIDFTVR